MSELNHSLYKSFMLQEASFTTHGARQLNSQKLAVSGFLQEGQNCSGQNADGVVGTPGLCSSKGWLLREVMYRGQFYTSTQPKRRPL